jgi:membrane protease YdiL (CAAX protease family)
VTDTPPASLRVAGTWPGPDWYRDPAGRHALRYWDGTAWTDRVADGRTESVDAVDPERLAVLHETGGDLRAAWPWGMAVACVATFLVAELLIVFASRGMRWAGEGGIWPIAIGATLLYGALLVTSVVAHRRYGERSFLDTFGLRFRWSDIAWGFLLSIAARVAAVIVVLPIVLIEPDLIGTNVPGEDVPLDLGLLLALTVTAGIAAPLVEEVFFRGLLQRSLETRLRPWVAVAISSVLFGFAHVNLDLGRGNVGLVLVTGIGGAFFGVAARWQRRIGLSIVAHAAYNAIPVALVWAVR